jgi:hypothetical protein
MVSQSEVKLDICKLSLWRCFMKKIWITFFLIVFFCCPFAYSAEKIVDNTVVDNILRDVIDQAIGKAKEVVRQNTGIDLERRGYELGRKHKPLPSGASEEMRRELDQLENEHDRKIRKLEEELDRKLTKERDEFKREAGKEDKPEKIAEKRAKLEKKVDEAYAKFDEKVDEENRRFDRKREQIIEKSEGMAERGKNKGEDRWKKGEKEEDAKDAEKNAKGEKKGFFERWFGGSKKE